MLDTSSQLLTQITESYRQGCTATMDLPTGSGDLFSEKLEALMAKRLPLQEQLLLRRYSNARSQGMVAARHRQLTTAAQLFEEARKPLQMATLSRESKLLHQSFLEQSAAYLDYCHQDFDQVYSRTEEALRLSAVLEEEYGYDILLMQRIQLLHNLVRTEARQLNFTGAIALAAQLLAYLDGQLQTLPTPHPWGFERIARQPPEFVSAMFAQITSEVALILADKDRNQAANLLTIAADYLQLPVHSDKSRYSRSYAWFSIKHAFVEQDITTFLTQAAQFLAQGRADTPLLWYTIIHDLLALCNEQGWLDFRQEIVQDSLSWNDLPHKLILMRS
ncbi:hypothetical protein ACN23B_10660 [Anabaena sp. FACHB-709]|uniref:Uncharacterized protein n=2 Tax=Nostocaceae TaxID=1162 RepID=A0A1Z4KFP9_ANAVA|nr:MULTISPECIES: hypothetical protein [Nostocaceae]BAY67747.1 hypothetical protein NIES23_05290 [Trichormus variabilis NIES-23]HBW30481.1 hypothetical protein [Nostoc sp. UBA8866]MBD2170158.1 hypothetical protein [Anabaena cylindrica FACHB-318]MBD2265953.1 hypothetical protein [Anabaena sp. FACHB-709]MBD2275358.1 hypothetical protein [Nostoc sp. PCC 7120 = FACHB-418]